MTEIEIAMMHYDGDGSKPYCDLVHEALKEKRDREKGCSLCTGDKGIISGKKAILQRTDGGVTMWPVVCCPNCGRKLEQRTNNESEVCTI